MSASPKFHHRYPSSDETDLLIQSSDDILFAVKKTYMQDASLVFLEMLLRPCGELHYEETPVPVTECASVFVCLLDIIHPNTVPRIQNVNINFTNFWDVRVAAQKYELERVQSIVNLMVLHPSFDLPMVKKYLYAFAWGTEAEKDHFLHECANVTLTARNFQVLSKWSSQGICELLRYQKAQVEKALTVIHPDFGDPWNHPLFEEYSEMDEIEWTCPCGAFQVTAGEFYGLLELLEGNVLGSLQRRPAGQQLRDPKFWDHQLDNMHKGLCRSCQGTWLSRRGGSVGVARKMGEILDNPKHPAPYSTDKHDNMLLFEDDEPNPGFPAEN